MNNNTKNNSKGFSSVILVVALAGILVLFGLYIYKLISDSTTQKDLVRTKVTKQVVGREDATPKMVEEFEELDEPEGTPEEIDNDALKELDKIINDLEADTTLDDDLSDL